MMLNRRTSAVVANMSNHTVSCPLQQIEDKTHQEKGWKAREHKTHCYRCVWIET